jgi:hypothetical protein
VCCIALYRVTKNTKKFNGANVKYVGNVKEFTSGMSNAKVFLVNTERDLIEKVKADMLVRNYVAVEIMLSEERHYVYRLYSVKDHIPCNMKHFDYNEIIKNEFEYYIKWNRLTHTYLTAIHRLAGYNNSKFDDIRSITSSLTVRLYLLEEDYDKILNSDNVNEKIDFLFELSNNYNITSTIDLREVVSYSPIFKSYFDNIGGTIMCVYDDIVESYPSYIEKYDRRKINQYIRHIKEISSVW